jgi:DNA adenine methylase
LPELLKHVPEKFGTYHEPFVGGGALFFALQPECAVISDVNLRLIRTYRAVRDDVETLIAELKKCRYDEKFYYKMRERPIDAGTDVEVAAWFIYLNKTGFNGLYRVNSKGGFNVPFGRYTNPTICDAENLRACSRALQHASILHQRFNNTKAKRGDFIYCDPPYAPVSKVGDTKSFTAYSRDGFTGEDQVDLARLARKLKREGVRVLLTNSPVARLFYKNFKIREVDARRSVNSSATGRGAVKELIIT